MIPSSLRQRWAIEDEVVHVPRGVAMVPTLVRALCVAAVTFTIYMQRQSSLSEPLFLLLWFCRVSPPSVCYST